MKKSTKVIGAVLFLFVLYGLVVLRAVDVFCFKDLTEENENDSSTQHIPTYYLSVGKAEDDTIILRGPSTPILQFNQEAEKASIQQNDLILHEFGLDIVFSCEEGKGKKECWEIARTIK